MAFLVVLDLLVHMLVAGNYGYFRDELYYLVAGRHLAFGYVDFPPMIALLAAIVHRAASDSLVMMHVIPAVSGALVVLITGLMARELGGSRFSQFLAALASLVSVTFLATASIFSMDVLDEFWWALGALILIRMLNRDRPRLWVAFGIVCALGLLTKLTILFFGFAVVVGMLLTPARSQFRTRWPWLGGVVASMGLLPYGLWNSLHGWPTIGFWAHYGSHSPGVAGFLLNQLLAMNPLTVPLSLAGLYWFLRARDAAPHRSLGYAFVILYVLLAAFGAKAYFLAPAYPMLFAAGAVGVGAAGERLIRATRPLYAGALAVSGILLAPLAMPLLPPGAFAATYGLMSGAGNASVGQRVQAVFPQYLGDRFGWDAMVDAVGHVYDALPASEQASACILTANYGEASAINILAGRRQMPPAISGHNNYYLWGPGRCSGTVLILVGKIPSGITQDYADVTAAPTFSCRYCMPEENDLPISVARNPRFSLPELWLRLKHDN